MNISYSPLENILSFSLALYLSLCTGNAFPYHSSLMLLTQLPDFY